MKYVVDGREAELSSDGATKVTRLSDRLLVKTADGSASALAVRRGEAVYVSYRARTYRIEKARRRRLGAGGDATGEALAPMPGQIVEVLAAEGDVVAAGDRLLVLEAMKMQQPIVAPRAGTVARIAVSQGDQVSAGQVLAVVEAGGDA
ncbi:MAG: acetyl-CoA carboxylase biotin carboxyl carrier protein subunit [Armatimonadetes bacterium]|nr:acetyl-CoA carboxylase biotin carboxyl carrier protein subunit [Armatimonadota bacterium]